MEEFDMALVEADAYPEAFQTAPLDYDFDLSEFFDFENAALDPDSPQPSLSCPRLTDATTPATLRSKGSSETLKAPNGPAANLPPNHVLNIAEGDRKTAIVSPPLNRWPIEHVRVRTRNYSTDAFLSLPTPSDSMQPPPNKKRSLEEHIPGVICFDSSVVSNSTKKRKQKNSEQRDDARRVRAQGACLWCHVQKLRCSEGRPCEQCQSVFNRAYGSKTLQWTACVSSNLPDINIFALGISLHDDRNDVTANGGEPRKKLDVNVASSLYQLVVDPVYSFAMIDIDALYAEVSQYNYGHRAPEVHPFILSERNPLHLLVQLNVILLGSPVIGHKLIGYIRYLQKLRAICRILAFEVLGKAFNRTTLAASTPIRQLALVVQAALLLDQVAEMSGEVPAAVVCLAQDKIYSEMHQHLTQYISHYIQKLVAGAFGKNCELAARLQKTKHGDYLGEAFWHMLSDLIPSVPYLRRPPKLRGYGDMSWNTEDNGVHLEDLYDKMFSYSPIACN
ncbi:uncharacterized protein BDZ99DRAFT_572182 [Mytilinidion resinicola]|uniref:Zn(2)-C6 fungal-type domain-containing protein n=1 Tax=Mytilinidion resinicola TaxID=574789 RepID=A0A6A6YIA2_9PEZI|nr:uncharacterized protein BDZ99DRAFT_572182 [Mytilinidion resinicola]KAF2808299.1 hypothetical protein BDZ99DRAFT_572182 [Mytilinidion resinicola]